MAIALCSPFPGYDILVIVCGFLLFLAAATVRSDGVVAKRLLAGLAWWVPFLVLCSISVLWSGLPEATVRGTMALIAVLAAGYRVACIVQSGDLVRALALGLRMPLLFSVISAAVVPGRVLVASEYQTGALQGIFAHRNFLAFAAGMLIVIAIARWRRHVARPTVLFDIALGSLCLAWAQSQTAILSTAISIVAVLMVMWGRRLDAVARTVLYVGLAIVSISVAFVAVANVSSVTQGLGRDTTLTGRTDVWQAVLEEIPRHLWLGAGWSAVWREGLPVSARMWLDAGFKMYHAHNGYLDLVLQVGVIGSVAFVVAFFRLPFEALAGAGRGGREEVVAAALGGTILLIISNLSESGFVAPSGWASLVVLQLALRRAGVETCSMEKNCESTVEGAPDHRRARGGGSREGRRRAGERHAAGRNADRSRGRRRGCAMEPPG
nr:O-antigen ligase [Pseudonocardia sp. AL041005-10]